MDRPLKSVTHGQCNARPMVTFPAAEHHRPLAGTKLYCLVTRAHGCEQLAQSCRPAMHRPGVEPVTFRSRVQRPSHYATEPPQAPKTMRIIVLCWNTVLRLTGGCVVLEDVSDHLQVLPYNQNLNGSHLQCLQRLLHSEAIAPGILRDLIKIFPYNKIGSLPFTL